MNRLVPISRRELIQRLGELGFSGPYAGSGHDYMIKGNIRVTIPNLHHGRDLGVKILAKVLKEGEISRYDWLSVK